MLRQKATKIPMLSHQKKVFFSPAGSL